MKAIVVDFRATSSFIEAVSPIVQPYRERLKKYIPVMMVPIIMLFESNCPNGIIPFGGT